MSGIIVHFRGSHRRRSGHQMIVVLPGVDSREGAQKYLGKTVTWSAPGKQKKQISGKVSAAHGNKGAVRVIFETGMPGQSLGEEVKVE